MTTAKWVFDELANVHKDASRLDPTVDIRVQKQLDTVEALRAGPPISDAEPVTPSRRDIRALRHEGKPWSSVAPVAEELRLLGKEDLVTLADQLVMPDDNLRWRLFHLAVLGEFLSVLREEGAKIVSLRPLSGSSSGPAYKIVDLRGAEWDLWFEAAGIWAHYDEPSPHVRFTAPLSGRSQPIGTDIVLFCPHKRALVLECKYSESPTTVGRQGYFQALSYALELRTSLCPHVVSLVVSPSGVGSGAAAPLEFKAGGASVLTSQICPVDRLAAATKAFLGTSVLT